MVGSSSDVNHGTTAGGARAGRGQEAERVLLISPAGLARYDPKVRSPGWPSNKGMKTNRSDKAGFTLTEMMIVVAVIGLLAALAIPNFAKARQSARSAAFINDLRVAGGAFQMYAIENRGYPPNASGGTMPSGMASYLGNFSWTGNTPIGGRWNWDYNINGYRAGVAVTSVSADIQQLTEIDTKIDNGDLSAGQFRSRPSGYVSIIED